MAPKITYTISDKLDNKIIFIRRPRHKGHGLQNFHKDKEKTKCRGRDKHNNNTLTISIISKHKIYNKTIQIRQRVKDKIIIHPK